MLSESRPRLHLVPPANCASALEAQVGDEEIRLVRAPNVGSAVRSLEAFADGVPLAARVYPTRADALGVHAAVSGGATATLRAWRMATVTR